MPRGDRANWGGKRTSSRPDAKKAGRPKAFSTVKVPAAHASLLLDWLLLQRATLDPASDLCRSLDFLIAGLWTETNTTSESDHE